MLRIFLGVIAGFIAWLIVWVGSEKILSAVWPAFDVHQAAFQAAIENGALSIDHLEVQVVRNCQIDSLHLLADE